MQVKLDLKANIKRWWKALVVALINILSFIWIAGFCTGVLGCWGVWCLGMSQECKKKKGDTQG